LEIQHAPAPKRTVLVPQELALVPEGLALVPEGLVLVLEGLALALALARPKVREHLLVPHSVHPDLRIDLDGSLHEQSSYLSSQSSTYQRGATWARQRFRVQERQERRAERNASSGMVREEVVCEAGV
jgi:hypothetical protein